MAKQIGLMGLFTAVLIVLVEGTCSLAIFVKSYFRSINPVVVQYDPELGWSGIANVSATNVNGITGQFRTNSLGLRMRTEIPEQLTASKRTIICSGDSFTAGDGVSDGEEWCNQLAKFDSDIIPVILAQSGHSLDQSYLLYQRLRDRLKYQEHIVAFTGLNIRRLNNEKFNERYKPQLMLQEGKIVKRRETIPHNDFVNRRMAAFLAAGGLNELRLVDFASRLIRRAPSEPVVGRSPEEEEQAAVPLAIALLKSMAADATSRGARLRAVYLPTYFDYYHGDHRVLRRQLRDQLGKAGIRFDDFTDALSTFPVRDIVEGGNGHYRANIHTAVAQLIEAKSSR